MAGLGRTGGFYPGLSRTGGAYPLSRRVLESLQGGRGSAWSAAAGTAVYIENLVTARIVAFYLYEQSQRMANQFTPWGATSQGTLSRWERIFGLLVGPNDTDQVRQARLAGAWASISTKNRPADLAALLSSAMGLAFVAITPAPAPANANVWWPAGATADLPSAHTATATIPWYSNVCLVSVQVTSPAGWTAQMFNDACSRASKILDANVRAWETWQLWQVDPVTGVKGFYLDRRNLGWSVFA